MSARLRTGLFGAVALLLMVTLLLVALLREHSGLPDAASQFLQASIAASEVTTCLQGVQDELFVPGVPRMRTHAAVHAALSRLRGCDLHPLESALARVDLPPQAPITDPRRRRARADLVKGVALMRRVVLDTRGAVRAVAEDVTGSRHGAAIVLAYRAATSESDAAYALALQALSLLGRPQSTSA